MTSFVDESLSEGESARTLGLQAWRTGDSLRDRRDTTTLISSTLWEPKKPAPSPAPLTHFFDIGFGGGMKVLLAHEISEGFPHLGE